MQTQVTHRIGHFIKRFEESNGTVADFNKLFSTAPIEGMQPEYEVEIGDIVHSTFTRKLSIFNSHVLVNVVEHDFHPLSSNFPAEGKLDKFYDEDTSKE